MDELSQLLATYTPVEFDQLGFWKILALFCAVCIGFILLGRLLGKRSTLNHSLSSAIGIVLLYLLGATLYSLKPQLHFLLSSLPFIRVSGQHVVLFPIQTAAFSALCTQIFRMTILAFLVILLENWLPQGKNVMTWYLLRFATVAIALVLQYGVFWLFDTYLPEVLIAYAPAILVVLLVSFILVGALKIVIGLFLATINPLIAGLYAFFFVNKTGKILSKAVFTALLLAGVVYGLNALGYTVISITTSALTAFIPAVIVLLLLWYVVRKVL